MSYRDDWWLIGNNQFGVHRAEGRNAAEAKADVRDRITETCLGEGLSASAARRAASSYQVFVIAGPLPYETVRNAQEAWDCDESGPVVELARRHRNYRVAARLEGARRPVRAGRR
jgi:hypothetical protein